MTARNRESGQITLMAIGFAVVLALAVAVVANASNAFLQRRSLASWTDGAVTVAAQHVAHDRLYSGAPVTTLPLSEAAARDAVLDYVARHGLTARFDGFGVDHVTVESAASRVTVELGASVPLMLAGDITNGSASFRVTARSTAMVPFE